MKIAKLLSTLTYAKLLILDKWYSTHCQKFQTYFFHFIFRTDKKPKKQYQNLIQFKLAFVFFLLLSLHGYSQAWYNTNWNYRKAITIDYTKVGPGPHANIPVLIKITDAQLASNALASGFDILFTDTDGVTKLNYDRETFNKVTGTLVAWVKIPSLSSVSNTVMYMYYGNASATDQQQATLVYDSNYQGVWHMNDATNQSDATTNNRTGTNTGTVTGTGIAANGRDFEETNRTDNVNVGNWNVPAATGLTLQCWVKFEGIIDAEDPRMISKALNSGEQDHVFMLSVIDPSNIRMRLKTGTSDTSGTTTLIQGGGAPLTLGVWHFCVATYDRSNMRLYRNGVQVASVAKTGNIRQNTWNIFLGNNPGAPNLPLDGLLDEVRISSVARSASWLLTEYNNQNSPSTFYSVGTESCNLPTTPTSTAGTAAACTQITANWVASANATGYYLDVSTVNTFASFVTGYNNLNVGNVLTRNVTGLTAGVTYYYRVRATNSCGTSSSSGTITYATSPATPAAAGTISGTATVCQGQNNVSYSVPIITNATSYTWSYSGSGATISGSVINPTINFSTTATSGNLTVRGTNTCGNGTVSANYAITVNPLPTAAGTISGTTTVCQDQNSVSYSVPAITNATSYTWSYSGSGATISGSVINPTINFSTTATSGNLTVRGTNTCGNGTVSANYAITVNPLPTAAGTISGTATVCQGQNSVSYSIPSIANATSYTWSYSGSGATISGSVINPTINFSTTATSGNLTVRGTNTCGNGTVSVNYAITVNATPTISPNKVDETCPASNNGSITPVLSGGISNIRYIKLTQKYASWQQVQEIQAFEIFTGTNVALASNGSSATSFSNYIDDVTNYGPQKAIDGDYLGYSFWHSNSTNIDEYIIVDLASAKNIDFLRIHNRVDCCHDRGQNMLLELFDASNNLVYSKTVDLWGGINGSHYIDVNVLDVSWTDATTTLNRTALDTGTYTLNYADAVGCSISSPINIGSANTAPLAPTLSSVTQPTCTTSTGSFTITNYNASYTYTVTPSTGVTQSGNTITAPEGTYTVIATLASCFSPTSASVVINPQPANIWNGSVSEDWNDPVNWCSGVPTTGVANTLDVVIPSGLTNYPIIFSGATAGYVNTLVLENNTTLTVWDNSIRVTENLKLDGKIDLEGESQLLQDLGSTLDPTSSGTLERDQQGTADTFTYNYWSSPVVLKNTNNISYKVPDVLKDGTVASTPLPITFLTSGYNGSAGVPGITGICLADYWIWKFNNLQSNNYSLWQHVRSTGTLLIGEGFSMKGPGTGSIPTLQNYVFEGKPNNGDIELDIDAGNDYLVGNPYPSALDANQFILDNDPTIGDGNGGIDGTLFFWKHEGGGSHLLSEYQGGYATYSLAGGVPAPIMGNSPPPGFTEKPERYIPVAQGFFVTAEASGTIKFNNNQRVFQVEDGINSLFTKSANTKQNSAATNNQIADTRTKLRLGFKSVNTINRQLLATIDPVTSAGYDWGYDAPYIDSQIDDMYWMLNDKKYTIQGINEITESTVLPLGIHTKNNGLNSIAIHTIENANNNLNVFVHDKTLNTYHNLKNGNYEVYLAAGQYLDRFEITFKNNQLLANEDIENSVFEAYYSNENESITIHNPNSKTIFSTELLNMLGQSIYKFDTISNQNLITIKANQISIGAYIIKIKTDVGIVSKKVLIK